MVRKRSAVPRHYSKTMAKYPELSDALESLGKTVRDQGPIRGKRAHLIQLAAAAAIHSEGAVHSHTKRALEAGATGDEIRHAIILLVSTIGYPTVAAALSWAEDILGKK
jgi:4-carboxymuconolactone decarboxylase